MKFLLIWFINYLYRFPYYLKGYWIVAVIYIKCKNIIVLDILMEISDDIKPIVCSDPYKLNVVGQVCQRGCPVHEYFHSKLFPKFSVCYYYKTFCVKLPCMYIMQFLIVYDLQMLLNCNWLYWSNYIFLMVIKQLLCIWDHLE